MKREVLAPEGIDPGQVMVQVNDLSTTGVVEGVYFRFEGLAPKDRVTITFPTSIRERTESVAGQAYTVTWKGNTVVWMEPEGDRYPTYLRSERLASEAPLAVWQYPTQRSTIHW